MMIKNPKWKKGYFWKHGKCPNCGHKDFIDWWVDDVLRRVCTYCDYGEPKESKKE